MIPACNRLCHPARYDRLHHHTVFRQQSPLFLFGQYVIHQQNADHIAGEGQIPAGFPIFYIHADAVGIRIGCHHKICIHLFCKRQRLLPGFFLFRVRFPAGCKITIRLFLFFHHKQVCKPHGFQQLLHRHISRTMKRRIYNPYLFGICLSSLRIQKNGSDCFQILPVHLVIEHLKQPLCHRIRFLHVRDAGQRHLCSIVHNVFIMRRCNLSAVFPVHLKPVIFCRIMTCGDRNTGNCVKLPNRKRQFRCRPEGIKHPGPDAVRIQTECCCFCHLRAVMPAVIDQNNSLILFSG